MKKIFKENQGVALLAAVLAMLILTVFTMGFAMQVGTDIDIGRAYYEKVKTFYIAQAGMNRARTAISVREGGWTLSEQPASLQTITQTESFAVGSFTIVMNGYPITNNRSRGRVTIQSTATLGTRTERILEEGTSDTTASWRDIEGYAAPTGGTAPNLAFEETSTAFNSGRGLGEGPYYWGSASSNPAACGSSLYIDFGRLVQFDHMLFVKISDSFEIPRWSVEIWRDTPFNDWVTYMDEATSSFNQPVNTSVAQGSVPVQPFLYPEQHWAVLNFTRAWNDPVGYCTTAEPLPYNSGSDMCIGVLPGLQSPNGVTTRRVRITFDRGYGGCTGSPKQVRIDWVEFRRNGFLTKTGPPYVFRFNGEVVRQGGILRPPKRLVER